MIRIHPGTADIPTTYSVDGFEIDLADTETAETVARVEQLVREGKVEDAENLLNR